MSTLIFVDLVRCNDTVASAVDNGGIKLWILFVFIHSLMLQVLLNMTAFGVNYEIFTGYEL